MKEQPFRSVKVPLKTILRDPKHTVPILFTYVSDINVIMTLSYQFIRLYCLYRFHQGLDLPVLDKIFCGNVMSIINYPNRRRNERMTELADFYHNHFKPLIPTDLKFKPDCLSSVCQMMSGEMATCLNTNISTHFVTRLKNVIRNMIKAKSEFDKLSKGQLRRGAAIVMSGLFERDQSEVKPALLDIYQFCLTEFIPEEPYSKNLAYDVSVNPQKYLLPTLKLNKYLEDNGFRPFQPLSLRTSTVPKNIALDTKALTYMLDYEGETGFTSSQLQNEYKKTEGLQHIIWNKYFNMDKKIMKGQGNYQFFYSIDTDGIGCTLKFIHRKYVKAFDNRYTKKENRKVNEDEMKQFYVKKGEKLDPDAGLRKLTDLSKEELQLLDPEKSVGLDPGMSNLAQLVDGHGNHLRYTKRQRYQETYSNHNRQIREKIKSEAHITDLEKPLNECLSKTMDVTKFKKYIETKLSVLVQTRDHYEQTVYRRMNLRHFIHVKKSEARLINNIEKTFGKDCHIFYGNWSRQNTMKYNAPVPGRGLRRLIGRHFQIFLTDEYGSSKYCYFDDKEVKNKKKQNGKKIHRCLICNECCSLPNGHKVRFMNRDIMGGLNIYKIGQEHLKSQTRPKAQTRGRCERKKEADPFDIVTRMAPKKIKITAPRVRIII